MIKSVYGLIVGDAIGVPVEFQRREMLDAHPVKGMTGYGTHSQPPGTWSDDSSLALAGVASINQCNGLNWDDMMLRFAHWLYNAEYTAHGNVFDVGRTTALSIRNYANGVPALKCGQTDLRSNGNGSLMRLLPVVIYARHQNPLELVQTVHNASRLTHAHPISLVGCGIYALIAVNLLAGMKPSEAVIDGYQLAKQIYKAEPAFNEYRQIANLAKLTRDDISGSGYIVDTLVASLWCLVHKQTYADAVLTAVNLGRDTDTVGAVTGSLAGISYPVPPGWIKQLQNLPEINRHLNKFAEIIA